ncbi:MAG: carboxypeptidase regulatory-like domain-containing protein [Planctomycetia bacterium]|nr:carboxypeptidase regulatory-like domain-containing protein [Planctomycetia bacterium]
MPRKVRMAIIPLAALAILLLIRFQRPRYAAAPDNMRVEPPLNESASSTSANLRAPAADPQNPAEPTPTPLGPLHIFGRVVRWDRSPAAGCRVDLSVCEPGPEARECRNEVANSNGEFRFESLTVGTYRVSATSEAGFVDVADVVDLSATGSQENLLLVLPDVRHITVTVVDSQGAGVPGSRVTIHSGKEERQSVTDDRGISRETVAGNEMVIKVLPPSDGPRCFLTPRAIGLRLPEESARVVLEDAGIATGVIWLEQQDRGWSGVPVLTLLGEREVSRTTAGAGGSFRAIVPIGSTVTLEVENLEFAFHRDVAMGSYPEGRLEGVRAGDQDLRLVVRLRPMSQSLRVVIQDPDGRGVPNARVGFRPGGRISTLNFDANEIGVAEIARLPDCDLDVYANLPKDMEGTEDWWRPAALRVRPAGQEVVLSFSKGIRLKGTVLGPDGEPQVGACLQSAQTQPYATFSDSSGRFSLLVDGSGVASISIQVSASIGKERLVAKLTGVDPRGGEVVVRLQPEK